MVFRHNNCNVYAILFFPLFFERGFVLSPTKMSYIDIAHIMTLIKFFVRNLCVNSLFFVLIDREASIK